jgi:hypothetical protein
MPLESILYLCLVVGAFAVFAIVLAYGDWATRQVTRDAVPFVSPSADSGKAQAHVHRTKSIVHETAT